EPCGQRQFAGVHDGPRRHRGLPPAAGALIGEGLGLQKPGSAVTAARADKPVRPTALEKVFRAFASLAKRLWNSINDFGNPPSDPDIASPRPSQTERSYLCVPVLYTSFRRTGPSYISLLHRFETIRYP